MANKTYLSITEVQPRNFHYLLMTLFSLFLLINTAQAQDYDVCSPDGVALGGYDATSYFEAGGPYFGVAEFVAEHNGLQYRFANQSNLSRFNAEPARYLPRYGGWCAANLSMGQLACPDYTNFKIEDDSLLLFEHSGFTNGLTVWNSNPLEFRERADQNAIELLGDSFTP